MEKQDFIDVSFDEVFNYEKLKLIHLLLKPQLLKNRRHVKPFRGQRINSKNRGQSSEK